MSDKFTILTNLIGLFLESFEIFGPSSRLSRTTVGTESSLLQQNFSPVPIIGAVVLAAEAFLSFHAGKVLLPWWYLLDKLPLGRPKLDGNLTDLHFS